MNWTWMNPAGISSESHIISTILKSTSLTVGQYLKTSAGIPSGPTVLWFDTFTTVLSNSFRVSAESTSRNCGIDLKSALLRSAFLPQTFILKNLNHTCADSSADSISFPASFVLRPCGASLTVCWQFCIVCVCCLLNVRVPYLRHISLPNLWNLWSLTAVCSFAESHTLLLCFIWIHFFSLFV